VARTLDLADLPIVDGHCHPFLADPWRIGAGDFADLFSEGRPGAMGHHVPQSGYYRRALRDLARLYGCPPDVPSVLARRATQGPDVAARALAEQRITALLVDTGFPTAGAMALAEMRRRVACAVHEVFRIETCAQGLLARGLAWEDYRVAFRDELTAAAARCVGLKSIIAYRSGLAIRDWPEREVAAVYRDVVTRVRAGGSPRLTEKPLLDTLFAVAVDVAREHGRPLQVHTGFGDPDIDLVQANPLLLRPLLEDTRRGDLRLVLLHQAYPYVREAAFMAAVWPQVHVDLSLAPVYLGAATVGPLVELLALAPATKLLFGSDVGRLPELFPLAAAWTRAALAEALGWLVDRGDLDAGEARAVARQVLADNAVALYRLR
jgi:hypothetical protein